MADFCHQCSLEIFGEDYKDLIVHSEIPYALLYTICEGCGETVVDAEGVCLGDCLEGQGKMANKWELQEMSDSKQA